MFKIAKGFGDSIMLKVLGVHECQRFWGFNNNNGFGPSRITKKSGGDSRITKVLRIQECQRFVAYGVAEARTSFTHMVGA